MTRGERIAQSILKPINPSIIIVLGIYTVVWGLWLISPFWTVFTQAPLYSDMHALAPEGLWGVVAVIAGGLAVRGALKPEYKNIQLGAFIGAIHWLVIAIMYFKGDWQNTGGITSLMVSSYCVLVWVNIKVNRHYYN